MNYGTQNLDILAEAYGTVVRKTGMTSYNSLAQFVDMTKDDDDDDSKSPDTPGQQLRQFDPKIDEAKLLAHPGYLSPPQDTPGGDSSSSASSIHVDTDKIRAKLEAENRQIKEEAELRDRHEKEESEHRRQIEEANARAEQLYGADHGPEEKGHDPIAEHGELNTSWPILPKAGRNLGSDWPELGPGSKVLDVDGSENPLSDMLTAKSAPSPSGMQMSSPFRNVLKPPRLLECIILKAHMQERPSAPTHRLACLREI